MSEQFRKRILRITFQLFHYSLIFFTLKKITSIYLKGMTFTIHFTLLVLYLITLLAEMYYGKSVIYIIRHLGMISLLFLFRSVLLSRQVYMMEISNYLFHLHNNMKVLFRVLIYIWIGVIIIMHAAILACTCIVFFNGLIFPINNLNMKALFAIVYSTTEIMCLMLPFSTFALYYAMICIQIRFLIQNFESKLNLDEPIEYNNLLQNFNKIKSFVNSIDNKLSFMVLLEIIYLSITTHYFVSILYTPQRSFLNSLSIMCTFLISFASFIIMIMSAALVWEASAEIHIKASLLPNASENTFPQLRFLMAVKDKICLTVWKIVPIKRNYSIGILGLLIYLYCIILSREKVYNCEPELKKNNSLFQ